MMKSLLAANRSEKDSFRIPHSVQQSIPIRRIYTDGIWQVGQKYSKTWRFSDINYAASSLDDRRSIFRSYGAVLNSLPTDATAKITIINRRLNPVDFQRTMLMPECSDGLDYYRGEYNQIILDKAAESNNLVQSLPNCKSVLSGKDLKPWISNDFRYTRIPLQFILSWYFTIFP